MTFKFQKSYFLLDNSILSIYCHSKIMSEESSMLATGFPVEWRDCSTFGFLYCHDHVACLPEVIAQVATADPAHFADLCLPAWLLMVVMDDE